MTKEEMLKKIGEFENIMSNFHNTHTRYGGRYYNTLSWYSEIMDAFGKNKEKKIYNQLLEEVKLVYDQMSHEEYMQLRYRIISAFEA